MSIVSTFVRICFVNSRDEVIPYPILQEYFVGQVLTDEEVLNYLCEQPKTRWEKCLLQVKVVRRSTNENVDTTSFFYV